MLKASHGDVGGLEGRSEVPEKVNRPSTGSYMAMDVSAVCTEHGVAQATQCKSLALVPCMPAVHGAQLLQAVFFPANLLSILS